MLSSEAKFVVLGSLGIGFLEPGVAMMLYFVGFCCVCMLKFCELPFVFRNVDANNGFAVAPRHNMGSLLWFCS